MTPEAVCQAVVEAARFVLSETHGKIEHCVRQLDDEQLWRRPTPEQNSIGNLMLHLSGNLRQWIVSGIGGAADVRVRKQEFAERGPIAGDELRRRLAETVREADLVLARVTPEELVKERRIQAFEKTGSGAIFDTLAHFKGHQQEIVCLTRWQLGPAYQFDYVPSREQGG